MLVRAGAGGRARPRGSGAAARTHIPRRAAPRVPGDSGAAGGRPRKIEKPPRAGSGRDYSNSVWHAGYKQLGDGRWLAAYQDDASRLVAGHGTSDEASAKHALEVLGGAVAEHGRPASVMTARRPPFYGRGAGESEFERRLAEMGIRHVLSGAGGPQAGKLARFFGEIDRKIKWFSGIDELVLWYNRDRPHDALDRDTLETPARAFARKMPGNEAAGSRAPA